MTNTETLPNLCPMPRGIQVMVENRVMASLRRYAEYEAACTAWYTKGDGRSTSEGGRGYRFPEACVHGSSAWTDYDNICGPCEGGYRYWDAAREIQDAYEEAAWAQKQSTRRSTQVLEFIAKVEPLPQEVQSALVNWAIQPVREF